MTSRTDTIRHHLTDRLLMAYSAGVLPEAFGLAVAAHLSMCDECRARAGAFDTVGGALIEDTNPAPLAETALADCLSRAKMPTVAPITRKLARGSVLPGPIRDYVGGDLEAVKWRPVGMGVKQAILPTDEGATARLLFIPAGTAMPDHGHRGMELTLCLQGAFSDSVDRFGPGDIEVADEDLDHMPVADIGDDCICLAVTDAPLRFSGWVPRIAQKFLRI